MINYKSVSIYNYGQPKMSNVDKYPKESRYYHFRINDLSDEQLNYIKSCQQLEWAVIGVVENDEAAKGKHYHVAIKFNHAVVPSAALKRLLYNSKLHTSQYYCKPKLKVSSVEQFIKYCIKNGVRTILGDAPILEPLPPIISEGEPKSKDEGESIEFKTKSKEQINQELFEKRWQAAQQGNVEWFMENDRKFMMTNHFGKLITNAQQDVKDNLDNLDNWWVYGEPGTGKSSSVDFLYPKCYRKIKNNEKWDSYYPQREGHEVVYFDELDTFDSFEMCLGGIDGMKEKTDVYPFPIRQNYGSRQIMIRPKTLIITSNFTPSQLFSQPNKYGRATPNVEMVLKAFNRRFKVVHISQWLELNGLVFDHQKKRIVREEEYFNTIEEEVKTSYMHENID